MITLEKLFLQTTTDECNGYTGEKIFSFGKKNVELKK